MSTDWLIIPEAVPPDLCAEVLAEIAYAEVAYEKDEQNQYRPTPAAWRIYKHIDEHHKERVHQLKLNAQPISVNVTTLRKLERPAVKISGKEGEVYFVVALSSLSDATGMFALHGYNAGEVTASNAAVSGVPNLKAGDAVIWTAENAGRSTAGGGGIIEVVIYK